MESWLVYRVAQFVATVTGVVTGVAAVVELVSSQSVLQALESAVLWAGRAAWVWVAVAVVLVPVEVLRRQWVARRGRRVNNAVIVGLAIWCLVAIQVVRPFVDDGARDEGLTRALGVITLVGVAALVAWIARERSVAQRPKQRECPWCESRISATAPVCRHCRRDVEPLAERASRSA